jgi:hypothetical protein
MACCFRLLKVLLRSEPAVRQRVTVLASDLATRLGPRAALAVRLASRVWLASLVCLCRSPFGTAGGVLLERFVDLAACRSWPGSAWCVTVSSLWLSGRSRGG